MLAVAFLGGTYFVAWLAAGRPDVAGYNEAKTYYTLQRIAGRRQHAHVAARAHPP